MDDIEVLTQLVAGAKLFASGKNDPKRPRVAGWGKQAASSSDESSDDEELPHKSPWKEGTPSERAIMDKAVRILRERISGMYPIGSQMIHLERRGVLTDDEFADAINSTRRMYRAMAETHLGILLDEQIPWNRRVRAARGVIKRNASDISDYPDGRPSSP